MFRIGDFARMTYLPVSTLRYYDECGLLKPARVDELTGYRYYGAEQMLKVSRIQALKEAGFSLTEIRSRIFVNADREDLLTLLREKEEELRNTLKSEQERLERLRNWMIAIEREGNETMMEVTIKKVETIWVAGLRTTVPGFEHIDEAWKELNAEIDRHGVKKVIPCMMLYHSGNENGQWDVEVIEPIQKVFTPEGAVKVYELPGTERMASIIHEGPFETIGGAFAALGEWFVKNGYNMGMTREIYHKGDWMTDDVNEYITEIQAPIE